MIRVPTASSFTWNQLEMRDLSCPLVVFSVFRTLLHALSVAHLIVPDLHTLFGRRSFAFAAPALWNSLPNSLRYETFLNFKN
jgi:hypothetical protein